MDWSSLEAILGPAEKKSADSITWEKHRPLNVTMNSYSVSGGDVDECFLTFVRHPKSNRYLVYSEMVGQSHEIGGIVRYLAAMGADISAVHNHWLHTEPSLMYIHWQIMGSSEAIARAILPLWQSL